MLAGLLQGAGVQVADVDVAALLEGDVPGVVVHRRVARRPARGSADQVGAAAVEPEAVDAGLRVRVGGGGGQGRHVGEPLAGGVHHGLPHLGEADALVGAEAGQLADRAVADVDARTTVGCERARIADHASAVAGRSLGRRFLPGGVDLVDAALRVDEHVTVRGEGDDLVLSHHRVVRRPGPLLPVPRGADPLGDGRQGCRIPAQLPGEDEHVRLPVGVAGHQVGLARVEGHRAPLVGQPGFPHLGGPRKGGPPQPRPQIAHPLPVLARDDGVPAVRRDRAGASVGHPP